MSPSTTLRAALACLLLASTAASAEEKWIQLFNGKDLEGWTPKIRGHEAGENFADTFRVEDGLLKVDYSGYDRFDDRFGHLFYDEDFANYRLRVEYRFVGEQVAGGPGWAFRNSGLMLHGQSAESMEVDQDFPASIEVQLLGGRETGERTNSNLCTPYTHVVMDGELIRRHCTSSTSKTYRGDDWVTAEVEILGNRVRHILEGETVLEYTDPQLDEGERYAQRLLEKGAERMLRRGSISLQSESHPIHFRKVEILLLDDPDEAKGGEWLEPLAADELSKHWTTSGNWKLDEDGVVTLTPRPDDSGWSRFGDYLWLEGEYDDFEIYFDYKVEKSGNSGFYFHVGDESSPVEKGIEVQIYDSGGKGPDARLTDHDSGGIIPGIPPQKNTAKPAGEWNTFHITCRGDTLTVELNGEVVNEVKLGEGRLEGRPEKGSIGFQDHALPLALRKVRVRKL